MVLYSCDNKKEVIVSDQKTVLLDWGKSMTELGEEFIATETMFADCFVFINANETFNFEGLTAHDVIYGFCDSNLKAVKIGLYSKDFAEILELFKKKYGKASVEKDNNMEIYKIRKNDIQVYITYDSTNGKGVNATLYWGEELAADDLIEFPMTDFEGYH